MKKIIELELNNIDKIYLYQLGGHGVSTDSAGKNSSISGVWKAFGASAERLHNMLDNIPCTERSFNVYSAEHGGSTKQVRIKVMLIDPVSLSALLATYPPLSQSQEQIVIKL